MFACQGACVNPLLCQCPADDMVRPALFPAANWDTGHVVDIFDEVDEDVRRERMRQAAKRYGPIGIAVLVLAIGGVGGTTFWKQHQLEAKQTAGAQFVAAVRAQHETPGAGQATFSALAEEGPGGYPVLARLKLAESLAQSGDRAGAIAALNGVESLEAPERYKELARLLALGLRSYTEAPETLLPLVEPLTAPGRPWRALAIEQAAMLEWKLGRLPAARARLETISKDLNAPIGLRARADAALSAIPES